MSVLCAVTHTKWQLVIVVYGLDMVVSVFILLLYLRYYSRTASVGITS